MHMKEEFGPVGSEAVTAVDKNSSFRLTEFLQSIVSGVQCLCELHTDAT